jgi:hypothetical protein
MICFWNAGNILTRQLLKRNSFVMPLAASLDVAVMVVTLKHILERSDSTLLVLDRERQYSARGWEMCLTARWLCRHNIVDWVKMFWTRQGTETYHP